MRHALLVFTLVDLQAVLARRQRLAYPQHTAVPEDGENAFDEFILRPVERDILIVKISDHCFANGYFHN